jgi:hypothetical protein
MYKPAIYSTVNGLMSSSTSFLLVALMTRGIGQDSRESIFMLMSLFILLGLQRSTLGFRTIVSIPEENDFFRRIGMLIFIDFVYIYFAIYLMGNHILSFSLSLWTILAICITSSLQDYMRFIIAAHLKYRVLIVCDIIPLFSVLLLFVSGLTGLVALYFWAISNLASLIVGLMNSKSWKPVNKMANIRNRERKFIDRFPVEGFTGMIITNIVIYVCHAVDPDLGITLVFMCISSYSVVNIFGNSAMFWVVPFFSLKRVEERQVRIFFKVFLGMILSNITFFLLFTQGNLGNFLYGSKFNYVMNLSLYFALSSAFLAFFTFLGHYLKARDQIRLVNQLRIVQVLISVVFFTCALRIGTIEAVGIAELVMSILACLLAVLAAAKPGGKSHKIEESFQ